MHYMEVIKIAAWETAVPAPETPAERHERDVEAQRGDWSRAQLKTINGELEWTPRTDNELTYVGPTALGGRVDREYEHRGGDHYLDDNGELALDPDGRNSREYADPETLVSAVNGQVYDDAENLQGSPLA